MWFSAKPVTADDSLKRLYCSGCLLLVSGSHSSEVEHFIGNEEVSGSNPDVSTRFVTQGMTASEHAAGD